MYLKVKDKKCVVAKIILYDIIYDIVIFRKNQLGGITMIIMNKTGNILNGPEKRIAFAVNTEGANDTGFAGLVASKFWPELAQIGPTKLGDVLVKQTFGYTFYALCCHSLRDDWKDQKEVICKCFDSIDCDEPVACIKIGTGLVGSLSGANFKLIREGMEKSKREIILY